MSTSPYRERETDDEAEQSDDYRDDIGEELRSIAETDLPFAPLAKRVLEREKR